MPIIELITSVTKVIVLLEHLLAPTASANGEEDGRMRRHFFSKTARKKEWLCDKKLAWMYKKSRFFVWAAEVNQTWLLANRQVTTRPADFNGSRVSLQKWKHNKKSKEQFMRAF